MPKIPMSFKELSEARRAGIPVFIIGKMSQGYELSEKEKRTLRVYYNKVYVEAYKKDGKWIKPHLRNLVKEKPRKDNRNLYGGQYRFSEELADVIKSNASIGHARFVHDMSAFVRMNHFDVHKMLESENINKKELMATSKDMKLWNTVREGLLIEGVEKLGKKYRVPLKRPLRIDSSGDIFIEVSQEKNY